MDSALESLQNTDLAEEIEAINAIYEPDTLTITNTSASTGPSTLDLGGSGSSDSSPPSTTIKLQLPEHPHLSFLLGFNSTYPDTPPKILGTASTASRGEGKLAVDVLEDILSRTYQPGAKSVFVGRAAHVTSLDQAKAFLDHLLATEKKVASATHNISAWRIREVKSSTSTAGGSKNGEATEMIVQDCDDDGETAAGGRLLHLMQLMDVWDVVVVVTRWYGGVLLGPDRFRIINAAGRDALVKGGFVKEKMSGEKGKKKGKK
ncbi:emp24/gp25L/p24 family/GOLD protein [Aspergillus niger]|uniref:Emp24/gp25L/p24 family/GOLD protein n=1 Tax=Aspergillus niger TaxID=5061 RepID=A0A505I7L6_ASPNG|nr:emp24/gp25L/p24 family/GOLD protein [Aspergillus niger]